MDDAFFTGIDRSILIMPMIFPKPYLRHFLMAHRLINQVPIFFYYFATHTPNFKCLRGVQQ